MKTFQLCALTGAILLAANGAQADQVRGGPKADFINGTLSIPCVRIDNLNENTNGQFFDVVLSRRGNSFNYELSTAEPADPALCQKIAEFAEFEEEDSDEPDEPALFVSCEVSMDSSEVEIEAKNLEAGEYSASILSGDNSLQSMTKEIGGDEVKFHFDSDSDAIADGAEAIETDFIVDGMVTAELLSGEDVLLSKEDVMCVVEEEDEEEEEGTDSGEGDGTA